jgi:hypothetical protein
MLGPILELRPSTAGWYFPADVAPARTMAAPGPRAKTPVPPDPGAGAFLGYGPDGRLRRAAPRSRLSLLA